VDQQRDKEVIAKELNMQKRTLKMAKLDKETLMEKEVNSKLLALANINKYYKNAVTKSIEGFNL
jgi:hypothetical protein